MYEASGIFVIDVDASDMNEAREKAVRILRCGGIEGYLIEVARIEGGSKNEQSNINRQIS